MRSSDVVFMGERVNEKAIRVLIYTAQAYVSERGSRGPDGGGGSWKLDKAVVPFQGLFFQTFYEKRCDRKSLKSV